jgi:hypothetical protein
MAQHFGRASLGGKLGISRPLTMTFPVLDISEILSTLHEMDIAGVAEDDLVKARPVCGFCVFEVDSFSSRLNQIVLWFCVSGSCQEDL